MNPTVKGLYFIRREAGGGVPLDRGAHRLLGAAGSDANLPQDLAVQTPQVATVVVKGRPRAPLQVEPDDQVGEPVERERVIRGAQEELPRARRPLEREAKAGSVPPMLAAVRLLFFLEVIRSPK